MKYDLIIDIEKTIKKLEKAKEYLQSSTADIDEMEILALGYLEKAYQEIFDIKEDICDKDL